MKVEPRILLLGGGYTLSRLAQKLDLQDFVITTTSEDKKNIFLAKGFCAEMVNISSISDIERLSNSYPSLRVAVDSVPPIKEGEDPLIGVRNIVSLLKLSKIERLVYLSSTGVFGGRDGNWVEEQTTPNPQYLAGKLRLESERIYREQIENFTALRISGIYGPGRGIGTALMEGRYKLIAGEDRWSNRIHVDDLASIIETCLRLDTLPAVICCSDDSPTKVREVVNFYCSKFNLAYPIEISAQEADAKGMVTLLSNQRVRNTLLKEKVLKTLQFPTYLEGAESEMHGSL